MKMKKAIGLALVMALLASFAYWLGYQHGVSSTLGRLVAARSLRQVGLRFSYHNDISRFSATGAVTTPKAQPQER
jgi:hypothetical protein